MPLVEKYAVVRGEYVRRGRTVAGIKWTVLKTGLTLKEAEGECLTLRTKHATTLIRPVPAVIAGSVGDSYVTAGAQ